MKLIVGLGNPGIEYQFTPHNVGFLTVDCIANRCGVRMANRQAKALTGRTRIAGIGEEVLLAKPETYMNLSGMAVRELVAGHGLGPEDVVLVHDEIDFPLGTVRIKQRGSSAGHNGVQSVMGGLETDEFIRVRIGVAPARAVRDGAHYLLSPFRKAQLESVQEAVERAADAVEMILKSGVSDAMNFYNRREKPGGQQAPAGA